MTNFDTSTLFTIWNTGCTHFISTYFELYAYYEPIGPWDDTEVNYIEDIIKPQGIFTIILDL